MGFNCERIIIISFLVCILGYVKSQDYYESATVSTVSHINPRVIIIGMKTGKENVDNVVEEKRLRQAKNVLHKIRHTQHLRSLEPFLKRIPKKFEITGRSPQFQFNRYISEIQQLAHKENVTVQYKIKVEVDQVEKNGKRPVLQRTKTKKYNVPLKKKSMRLSNFEVLMRKLSDTSGQQKVVFPVKTTEAVGLHEASTTTKIPVKKYKPIISKVKTNYAKKLSKPVRKTEFILKKA